MKVHTRTVQSSLIVISIIDYRFLQNGQFTHRLDLHINGSRLFVTTAQQLRAFDMPVGVYEEIFK